MEKKKFFVNMGTQEISQVKFGNNESLIIFATDDEVTLLREKMNDMYSADTRAFYRAHVPIMSYHDDQSNDDYDMGMTGAFQMMYDLGDEATKAHIESMGILSDNHL